MEQSLFGEKKKERKRNKAINKNYRHWKSN